jgi:SMC interacting uncharacterized protein involved in chromosome segregation
MAEEREEADRNVEELEESGEKLEDTIRETKRDWEAKQSSDSVAGAVDPDDEDRPGHS